MRVIPCEIQSATTVACSGARLVTVEVIVPKVVAALGPKALVWTAPTIDVTADVLVINALSGWEMDVSADATTGAIVAVSADLDIIVVNAIVAAVVIALGFFVTESCDVDVLSDVAVIVLIGASTDVVIDVMPGRPSTVLTAITVLKFVVSAVSGNFISWAALDN